MLVKATEESLTRSTQLPAGSGMVAGQQPRANIARSQSDLSSGARRGSAARKEQEIEYFIPCVLPVREGYRLPHHPADDLFPEKRSIQGKHLRLLRLALGAAACTRTKKKDHYRTRE